MSAITGSIRQSRRLVLAVVAIIAMLVLAAAASICVLRQVAIQDTTEDNRRLGVVLAEQTTRTLQAVDVVLQDVAEKVAASGVHDDAAFHRAFGTLDLHEMLIRRITDLPQTEAITILDSTGHFVNVSRKWPPPDYSLAERSYFRHFAANPDSGPFISEPSVSVSSGAATVFLVRRLAARDGAFLGVIVAPIRLDFFERFLVTAGLAAGQGVTVLRRDGTVLVRFPQEGVATGTRMPADHTWFDVVARGGGHYRSAGAFKAGRPSFVSVHVLTLYPLVIDVTRSADAALARWWRQAAIIGLGTLLATITLALLLRALGRQFTLMAGAQTRIDRQVVALRKSEAKSAAQAALLEMTLNHMEQGLIMIDAAGKVAIYNRRLLELLDLPPDLMAGQPSFTDIFAWMAQHHEFTDLEEKGIDPARLIASYGKYERRRPNGTVLEIRVTRLADGGMVRTYTDITARAMAEELLGAAASRDHLTGLPNRNGFTTGFEAALAVAQRAKGRLAVICLDLDGFKAVNDSLGHHAGDQLLTLVAGRIRNVARATDVVGRLGGDEFALVLPGAVQAGAELACQRMLEAISEPYVIDGQVVRIGVSLGIALFPDDGRSAEELLGRADTALYRAKASGRNTWRVFATTDGDQVQLEEHLRAAIAARQVSLAYQPICETATRQPVAFEALLRWTHPHRGPVSPAEFIPIAEQTGLIIPLGRLVIEMACAEAATWPAPLRVAVNLSPAQVQDPELLPIIDQALARAGLAPERLELELTEAVLLDDAADVVGTMQALRARGIRLTLGDFGIARSGIVDLNRYPLDGIKINRSFLRALNSDPQARAHVEAMLIMARTLALDITGEGVETREQLGLLGHLQCHRVQGYLLGRPATAEDTRALLGRFARLAVPGLPWPPPEPVPA